jgi:integrase
MAKRAKNLIFKMKNSPNWYFLLPVNGTERPTSTRTTDADTARMIASNARFAATNTAAAEKAVDAIKEALHMKNYGVIPVENIWKLYMATAPECNPMELRHRELLIEKLVKYLRKNKILNINAITPKMANRFAQDILRPGVKAKTFNIYLQAVRHIFSRILLETDLQMNPFQPVYLHRCYDSRHGRSWRPGEYDRILAECIKVGKEWDALTIHAVNSGFRYKDLCHLKWPYVGDDIIESTPAKTKKHNIRVWSPIADEVRPVLDRQRGKHEVWVYPERHFAYKPQQASGYNKILASAGIKSDDQYVVSFHCHRHEFATRLANAGVPEDIRKRLGGWTTSETAALYNHDRVKLMRAIQAISNPAIAEEFRNLSSSNLTTYNQYNTQK